MEAQIPNFPKQPPRPPTEVFATSASSEKGGFSQLSGKLPISGKVSSVTFRSPQTPILSVIIFMVAVFVFLLAYFVFSKPDTGPASLIFNRIFPKESGLIKLQEVDLDIGGVVDHPVFSRLKEQSPLPLEIPPLGKPNPFL